MKTAVLSDIHVDINRDYPVAQEFARYIKEQGARLAIIAGDVSESQQETLDTLNTIEQLSGARVLFVPGNHDLWGPKGDPDQIHGRRLENQQIKGGIPRVTPENLTALLPSLPPILYMTYQSSVLSYNKAPWGLSV